jgi:hypothetical protein
VARKTFRIGLVGVGATAQVNHIPALKRIDDFELVALCDRDPEKGARVAQKFQIPRSYSRLEELLSDDEVDVVDLCTPNYLHAPMAMDGIPAFYRALRVGHIPSFLIAFVFLSTLASVIGITVYVSKHTSGEISEFGTHRSLWRI